MSQTKNLILEKQILLNLYKNMRPSLIKKEYDEQIRKLKKLQSSKSLTIRRKVIVIQIR